MGDVIRGQFGRPRKPIEARLRLDLREEVITVDGEEWLVVTLDGDVVQVVPIQPGTAPEPKRLAKVLRLVRRRFPGCESPPCQPRESE